MYLVHNKATNELVDILEIKDPKKFEKENPDLYLLTEEEDFSLECLEDYD